MASCKNCGKELSSDEIAITKRLINRGAAEFLCVDCLAEYFRCSRGLILDRIGYYKAMGCSLFCSGETSSSSEK